MSDLEAICAKLHHRCSATVGPTLNLASAKHESRKHRRKPIVPRNIPDELKTEPEESCSVEQEQFMIDEHGALDLTCAAPTQEKKESQPEQGDPTMSQAEAAAPGPWQEAALPLPNFIGTSSALVNPFLGHLLSMGTLQASLPLLFGCLPLDKKPWTSHDDEQDEKPCVEPRTSDDQDEESLNPSVTNEDQISRLEVNKETSKLEPRLATPPSPAASTVDKQHSSLSYKGKMALFNTKAYEVSEDYIRRYASYEDCANAECRAAGIRDHFHCLQCDRVLPRREEMIRHNKWHKKREETLQYGFMRYSPGDNCHTESCLHNGKQTHYHCLQPNCDKIYISTSDVQMHANFHRKDAAIIQEGFQRFRASEDCGTPSCSFHRERTTHFHCRRSDCRFTFKNKADMEKHKSHHQRNDSFAKDGFKKFIKYEHCDFPSCKYSKMMNHIHCIRPGCNYVVHSSSQILSHKRKHDRRTGTDVKFDNNNESADDHSKHGVDYLCRLKSDVQSNDEEALDPKEGPNPDDPDDSEEEEECYEGDSAEGEVSADGHTKSNGNDEGRISSPQFNKVDSEGERLIQIVMKAVEEREKEELWREYIKRYTANDPCTSLCPQLYKDHYHCILDNCNEVCRTKEKVRIHARNHAWHEELTRHAYRRCFETPCLAGNDAPESGHFHCLWPGCQFISPLSTSASSRTQHYGQHNHAFIPSFKGRLSQMGHSRKLVEPVDGDLEGNDDQMTPKRRGRPPKYRKDIVVPKVEIPEELCRDDPGVGDVTREMFAAAPDNMFCGFKMYPANNPRCVDDQCPFYGTAEHFHCLRPRCHHTSDNLAAVNLHRREFHYYLTIKEGFEFFDRSVNCRRPHCHNNRTNRHYHCVRHNCDYSFVRYNTMQQHSRKHEEFERGFRPAAKEKSVKLPMATTTTAQEVLPLSVMSNPLSIFQRYIQNSQNQEPAIPFPPFRFPPLGPLMPTAWGLPFPHPCATINGSTETTPIGRFPQSPPPVCSDKTAEMGNHPLYEIHPSGSASEPTSHADANQPSSDEPPSKVKILSQQRQRTPVSDLVCNEGEKLACFRQFVLGEECGQSDCEHVGSPIHFHCLNCPYSCTDNSKTGPHALRHGP